ncbi:uncharacterized protein TRAVEDRAFT_50877 [Trametes versicolor FP-101664 SS1]|uniref:uncharacterized protein n=1 Tax=Trametes versicolor (strain FP-101664) TaxID=717944 RepID=UPI0004621469|nr:uncharacterized protein TRAVEDRAFT_50877 [Trametes versicolor FP-101664 SS1]EIW54736.1 hypothetical protein TRAVEDRAFT_50877 [Trametes versicolor FP-101664 SS1]
MSWHLLAQAGYPPTLHFPYRPPGAPSSTWYGSTSTSPNPGTPPLPSTPTLRTVPLPSTGDYELYRWDARIPPTPPTATKGRPRAPAALLFQVDPLIAYTPQESVAHPSDAWDLLRDPSTIQLLDNHSQALKRHDLTACWAVRVAGLQNGEQPLCSLVLIFRGLPLQIKIPPSHVSSHDNRRGRGAFVSIWDVLAGLYNGLRAPVDQALLAALSSPDKERVCRAAVRRMQVLEADRQQGQRHVLRNVDLLGGRRFLGIRVATPSEVQPWYWQLGDSAVFVVEVGSG